MNGNNFLLNTNIVLYLLNGDKLLAGIIGGKVPYISFITEMEVLSYSRFSPSEEKMVRAF